MFDHIRSFDPYILEDQLLQLLQRSPQTENLVSMRAQQIIQDLLSSPIIHCLSQDIKQLTAQLSNQKKSQQINNASSSKQSTILRRQLNEQKTQNKQLHEKLMEKSSQIMKLNAIVEAHQQLKKDNGITVSEKNKLSQKSQRVQLLCEQQKQSIEKYRVEVHTLNQRIQKLQERNKILIQELDKNKSSIKNMRATDIQMRKYHEDAQAKKKSYEAHIKMLEEKLKEQANKRQNERKQLNIKLKQLNRKCKNYQKAMKKIQKNIYPLVRSVMVDQRVISKVFKEEIRMLEKKVKEDYILIMDEIGAKMMLELEHLMIKIQRMNMQTKTYRSQLKIKDQIIHMLEIVIQQHHIGNNQLKKQLREKKISTQILQNQLKRNYEEYEIKLKSYEYAYHGILYDTSNLL